MPSFAPSNYPKKPLRLHIPSSSDEDNDQPRPRSCRPASSDTDYSREHQAKSADRHRYPKKQLRGRLLSILRSGYALSILTMIALVCILPLCPPTGTDRLRNDYGIIEDRYRLTAYDCSNPTEVKDYSSVLARQCSVRATPVQRKTPTKFQLLQKEKKRYITAYSCSLFRTDISYNCCGVYGHPELDPIHWSFLVPQRVTFQQCLTWLRTCSYKLTSYSTSMHG